MKAHKVCCFWCVNRKCSLYIKIPQYKTLLLIWWKWQPFIQEREGYCVEPGIMSSYHELQWADQQEEADKNWTLSSGTISFQTQGMSHRFTANTGLLHGLFVMDLFNPPTHTQFYISMTNLSTLLPILISSSMALIFLFLISSCKALCIKHMGDSLDFIFRFSFFCHQSKQWWCYKEYKKVPLGKSLQQHVFPETLLSVQSIMHNPKNTL